MIDDLSDAYINIYKESYKNDWGYFCDNDNSSYSFLQKNLLKHFSDIKITFFVPYLKHNVINDNTVQEFKKYDIGERKEFIEFLLLLQKQGHEISHHGSNHGKYINETNLTTFNNFKHEWELFDSIDKGVNITNKGKEIFHKYLNKPINGGKFCGYKLIDNSLKIIDKCDFHYWCKDVNYITKNYNYAFFGQNNVISFPTNFAGNSFVRLSYITGDKRKDSKKKILKILQPFYNILQYNNLNKLYKDGHIISIQEHISPSTSSGITQSANIVSDIESLNKIYNFLSKKSIWYATCDEISKYIYTKENSILSIKNKNIIIEFNNYKNLDNNTISLVSNSPFKIKDKFGNELVSEINNKKFVINIPITNGKNIYKVVN
jgi:hypothetical protein